MLVRSSDNQRKKWELPVCFLTARGSYDPEKRKSQLDLLSMERHYNHCIKNVQVIDKSQDIQVTLDREFRRSLKPNQTKMMNKSQLKIISRNFWVFARKLRESLTGRWDSYWDSHGRLGEFNQLTSLTWLHRLSFSQKQDSRKIWTNLKHAKKEKL